VSDEPEIQRVEISWGEPEAHRHFKGLEPVLRIEVRPCPEKLPRDLPSAWEVTIDVDGDGERYFYIDYMLGPDFAEALTLITQGWDYL
jgi:hypothetical protein